MALFFDAEWFDARLATAGLTRGVLAQALGISEAQLAEVWKDQCELSARDVTVMAALLGASPEDVAKHAGISTPMPKQGGELDDIRARLDRIETTLAELKALVVGKR
jgi:transcriptional regulator with XRE-family HTH domain